MLSLLGYGLLAVLVAAVLFVAASYLLPAGEQLDPAVRDEPLWALPDDRRLDETDVGTVRLPVALRGYRFAETDLLLDRLAEELRVRDEQIARLTADRTWSGRAGAAGSSGLADGSSGLADGSSGFAGDSSSDAAEGSSDVAGGEDAGRDG